MYDIDEKRENLNKLNHAELHEELDRLLTKEQIIELLLQALNEDK